MRYMEHRSTGESQGSSSSRRRSARSPALPEPVGGRPANGRAMPEARYLEIVPTQVAQAHYGISCPSSTSSSVVAGATAVGFGAMV